MQGTQPAGAAGGQGTGPPAPGCRSASSGLTGPTPSPFFKLVLRFDLQTTVREEPRGLTAHAPTPRPGLTPDHGGQPRPALSPSPAGWNVLAHCVRPPVTRTPSFRPNERGRRLTIEEATRGQHRAGGASHTWSSPVAITGLHRELGPRSRRASRRAVPRGGDTGLQSAAPVCPPLCGRRGPGASHRAPVSPRDSGQGPGSPGAGQRGRRPGRGEGQWPRPAPPVAVQPGAAACSGVSRQRGKLGGLRASGLANTSSCCLKVLTRCAPSESLPVPACPAVLGHRGRWPGLLTPDSWSGNPRARVGLGGTRKRGWT